MGRGDGWFEWARGDGVVPARVRGPDPGRDPAHPDTPKEPEKDSDEYKQALAKRLLPKFESQLETLLADGRGEDSEPVIYHRAQIARHRKVLGRD